jgi:hypothetical protein
MKRLQNIGEEHMSLDGNRLYSRIQSPGHPGDFETPQYKALLIHAVK